MLTRLSGQRGVFDLGLAGLYYWRLLHHMQAIARSTQPIIYLRRSRLGSLERGVAVDELQIEAHRGDRPPGLELIELEVVATDKGARIPAVAAGAKVIGDSITRDLRPLSMDVHDEISHLVMDLFNWREARFPALDDRLRRSGPFRTSPDRAHVEAHF